MKKILLSLLLTALSFVATAQIDIMRTRGEFPMPDYSSESFTVLNWPQCITDRMDSLLRTPLVRTSEVGLMVYDLTADSTLYTYNHLHTMRPASTMKLLTSISTLDRLGPNAKFTTTLMMTGQLDYNILRGNIVCIGGFDPCFDTEDMQAFVDCIEAQGIDTIVGTLVADLSMKDTLKWGQGWCWDDDNPTLSPLLIGKKDRFIEQLRSELRRRGIAVLGQGAATLPAQRLCIRSHYIDQVLPRMMKNSDNLYAEAMFYLLASSSGERPAKAEDARKIIRKLISHVGLNPEAYRLADGSGLSHYNDISPELEIRLLRHAYHVRDIRSHLWPVLPIAGVDGTLRSRMHGTAAQGNVHAKTGTLTGVSTLAGYCTAANGHVLAFSIMNQGIRKSADARAFQDRICNALCE